MSFYRHNVKDKRYLLELLLLGVVVVSVYHHHPFQHVVVQLETVENKLEINHQFVKVMVSFHYVASEP